MKKIFKVATLGLLTIFLCAGCAMREEFGFVIGKDKKVKLEVIYGMDNDMIDGFLSMSSDEDATFTDEDRWNYLNSQNESEDSEFKDFKAEKYEKDGYKGWKYTLDLGEIDNLIKENEESTKLDDLGKDTKLFTKKGDNYVLVLKTSDEQNSQMSQYAESIKFDLKAKVTLPSKAKSNNATTVEGTTYIWDLTKTQSMEIEFNFNGSNNTPIIIGCVACVLVACAVVAVVVINNKKKKNA